MKKISMLTALAMILALVVAFPLGLMSAASDGLVAYWAMDDGIGSTATDSSGHANDGILSGGKFGNALEFASGDQVAVGAVSVGSVDFTAEAFVKTSDGGGWKNIFIAAPSTSSFNTAPGWALQLHYGQARATLSDQPAGTRIDIIAGPLINDGVWHHIAVVRDTGAGLIRLFVDGIQYFTAAEGSLGSVDNAGPSVNIANSAFNTLEGHIDEARISNTARYTSDFPTPTSPFDVDGSTLGLWHLDDSKGSTATDAAGVFNGSITGASWAGPTWSTDVPPSVGGGYSLSFDGVDDYVMIDDTDDDELDITDELTIEAWVRTSDPTRNQQIVDKGEHQYEQAYMLMIYGGDLYGRVNKDSTTTCTYPYPTDGEWHHVAYTFKTGEQILFLDGVPVSSNDGSDPIKISEQPLLIGKGVERETYYWVQNIDEVCIFDKPLSPVEIALYAAGLACDGSADITLAPDGAINPINSIHTVTATIDPAVSDIPVVFEVTGANTVSGSDLTGDGKDDDGDVVTEGLGEATFDYNGSNAGADTITACIDLDDSGVCDLSEPQASVTKYWYNGRASGGGNIVDPHGAEKRKDWWHVSFGGAVYQIGALDSDVIGEWTTVFHNTSVPEVNVRTFEALVINKIIFVGASGEATRFVASGTLDGMPGYVLVVRAEDAGEPGSGCEGDIWYCDNIRFSLFYDVSPSAAENACGNVYDTSIDQDESCTVPFVGGDFPDHSSLTFGAERTYLDSGNLQIMTLP